MKATCSRTMCWTILISIFSTNFIFRDNYRHQGQSRHYEDRHQYDRNRYDDRRRGYYGNRHDEHDHRYGYDNRATRGFLRGQGYYRGGYRDYR